ncbi:MULTISPECIES: carbonate dehydratase [Corallincola]|uniref:Carbonic anhydrase n=3 Tax=Corallincola TaxID=1775176 RepID=A0A368NP54_9GAMM|nr:MULTISPECIES: carbonate dehydratase [Corallincola]RCU51946.1 carbonate dehydratase [Corallincola holothuriorum]TAA47102.1 carbonate dehydratase [Corallincola spongiicola]TCI04754.1 carbonate dehydratase [Corallincola luteus]
MANIKQLFENNRLWAERRVKEDPDYFQELAKGQSPKYLWVGCSDSRVAAERLTGLKPGELFVHRNVANQVIHTDLNCLSVLQYAIDVLKVEEVIICGHYACGGVTAAMQNAKVGLVNNWLLHIRDIYLKNRNRLDMIEDDTERTNRLSDLNVIDQVFNTCNSTVIQDAWARGQKVRVHGWIYAVEDGHLKNVGLTIDSPDDCEAKYRLALDSVFAD